MTMAMLMSTNERRTASATSNAVAVAVTSEKMKMRGGGEMRVKVVFFVGISTFAKSIRVGKAGRAAGSYQIFISIALRKQLESNKRQLSSPHLL